MGFFLNRDVGVNSCFPQKRDRLSKTRVLINTKVASVCPRPPQQTLAVSTQGGPRQNLSNTEIVVGQSLDRASLRPSREVPLKQIRGRTTAIGGLFQGDFRDALVKGLSFYFTVERANKKIDWSKTD